MKFLRPLRFKSRQLFKKDVFCYLVLCVLLYFLFMKCKFSFKNLRINASYYLYLNTTHDVVKGSEITEKLEKLEQDRLEKISFINENVFRKNQNESDLVPEIGQNLKCIFPQLPLDNPDIMRLIHNVGSSNPVCPVIDWIVSNGTHGLVNKSIWDVKNSKKSFKCTFKEIHRDNGDFETIAVPFGDAKVTHETEVVFKFENSDFVKVKCTDTMGIFGKSGIRVGKKFTWSAILTGTRSNITIPEISQGKKLNILIWATDSLSRNMYQRKLPKLWKFAHENLTGVTLKGYNVVGDGTLMALVPILTGHLEHELPEVQRIKLPNAEFVDTYPMIWKNLRKDGYLTGFMEDAPHIGSFTFRLNGFNETPTDFYMRPFFIEHGYRPCSGSMSKHGKMIDYFEQILKYHRQVPKFLFNFHGELTHDNVNGIQSADQDFVNFFQRLKSRNILEESILILMADHGQRLAFRDSQQGKLEERMPMFMFIFPSWFQKSYPKAYENFLINSERLSTPFDIHETLKDIPRLAQLGDEYFSQINLLESRGMSLFREIPPSRSCSEAKIDDHWCACLKWNVLDVNLPIVQKAGQAFVQYINDLLWATSWDTSGPKMDICSNLTLSNVKWAANLYSRNYLGESISTKDKSILKMQLKLSTKPGDAIFETSFQLDLDSNKYYFKESVVSRINKYGAQAKCIENNSKLANLRKYCYCLSLLEKNLE